MVSVAAIHYRRGRCAIEGRLDRQLSVRSRSRSSCPNRRQRDLANPLRTAAYHFPRTGSASTTGKRIHGPAARHSTPTQRMASSILMSASPLLAPQMWVAFSRLIDDAPSACEGPLCAHQDVRRAAAKQERSRRWSTRSSAEKSVYLSRGTETIVRARQL